jgi:protein SCO1
MARNAGSAIEAQGLDCRRPLNGPNAGYFPNVVVTTHENRKALFYDDLLRGKVVLVNFMSIKGEATYHATEKLVEVQRQIGERPDDHLFIYSITVDPLHDTPQALADFAEQHGVQPGWLFLTGAPADIETLRMRFFAHPTAHHHNNGSVEDCSMSMFRYGNEGVGLWGGVPVSSQAEPIAMRISWVQSRPLPVGPARRKGPKPLEFSEKQTGEGQ